ncbi:MAG: CotH kinase family protein, partial [Chitinispirillaceae bacterium]|nr:CotH kinase family protein [Chitinispirillaceae bacterium]
QRDTLPPTIPDEPLKFVKIETWSDEIEGGQSTVEPYEFETFSKTDSSTGQKYVSATINLVDNRPDLDWSSAMLKVEIRRKKNYPEPNNYSMFNTLELIMYLEKDKLANIRLVQCNLEEWKGFVYTIRGNGEPEQHFSIPLIPGKAGLDLTCLTNLRIEPLQYNFGKFSFTLKNATFKHSGYYFHTNFKLSKNDSYLFLSDPSGKLIDKMEIKSGTGNLTYGRIDSIRCGWLKFPTPGAKNVTEVYKGSTKKPSITLKGGFYNEPVTVALSSEDGAEIYYTLDGSIPSINSKKYKDAIKICSTTVLRYVSIKEGYISSEVITETYLINETTKLPIISIAANPASLFDPDTGIYMKGPNAADTYPYFGANFWQEKEIPANIEMYERNGEKLFSLNAGVALQGNWSRAEKKKAFQVNFRECYGKSFLECILFPSYPNVKKFKKIVLRGNGGTFSYGMIEDPMMQSLIDDRNVDYQKYRPVVLYINGEYFGIYQLREPANHDYVYSNYGLSKEEIDFFDNPDGMKWGNPDRWNKLIEDIIFEVGWMCDREFSDSLYSLVKKEVDIYNFIDYNALQIYVNNTDWPANNCRWWRAKKGDDKWKWLVYDLDAGFGGFGYKEGTERADFNTLKFALDETVGDYDYPNGLQYTYLLRALLKNSTFKEDFINRFATLLATNFSPERVCKRIDEMSNEIKDEIGRDCERWEIDIAKWQGDIEKLKKFAQERHPYIYSFIKEKFGLNENFTLSIEVPAGVEVFINGMKVTLPSFKGTFFTEVPLTLYASSTNEKLVFNGWSDGNRENPRRFSGSGEVTISPIFQ